MRLDQMPLSCASTVQETKIPSERTNPGRRRIQRRPPPPRPPPPPPKPPPRDPPPPPTAAAARAAAALESTARLARLLRALRADIARLRLAVERIDALAARGP